jgi:hypothetical protein
VAYRPYTAEELRHIVESMQAAIDTLLSVASKMETEGITPADFPFPVWLKPKNIDKIASDASLQIKDLIRQKQTGQEAEYLKIKRKNERRHEERMKDAFDSAKSKAAENYAKLKMEGMVKRPSQKKGKS